MALTWDDLTALENGEAMPFRYVTPVLQQKLQVSAEDANWNTQVTATKPAFFKIKNWEPKEGTLFDEDAAAGGPKVAIIGQTVVTQLYPGVNPIGQTIRIGGQPYDVIGTLEVKGQSPMGQDQDDIVVIPYTTAQARLSGNARIWQILVSASSPQDLAAAQQEVSEIMRESHKIGDGDDDFTVRNQTEIASAAQGTTKIMTWLLASIASVSLIVGGIGIMNIMLVSVTERTREIGIRMAIGARGSDVLTQFLVESIVMSVLGGAVGLAVGVGGAQLLAHFTGWSTSVPVQAVALAIGFSAAVGVFFGYYPARKAAALDPIHALRYE
jgi:putative ABC transport system permease protein